MITPNEEGDLHVVYSNGLVRPPRAYEEEMYVVFEQNTQIVDADEEQMREILDFMDEEHNLRFGTSSDDEDDEDDSDNDDEILEVLFKEMDLMLNEEKTPKSQPSKNLCKFDGKCNRANCSFDHPNGQKLTASSTAVKPEPQSRPSKNLCKFDGKCTRANCSFDHPNGQKLTASSTAVKHKSEPGICIFDLKCKRADCCRAHPKRDALHLQ
jgi:hypothetical protein